MGKNKVIYVDSSEGKLIAKKKTTFKDQVRAFKDMYDHYGIYGIFAVLGVMIALSLFLILFSYFYYDKDINNMLGFFGYIITLDLVSVGYMIPFLGIVLAFGNFFWGDACLLDFYGLAPTIMTDVIRYFYFVGGLMVNIYLTMVVLYYYMNTESFETMLYKRTDLNFASNTLLAWGLFGIGFLLTMISSLMNYLQSTFGGVEIAMLLIGGTLIFIGVLILMWGRKSPKESTE